MMISGKGISGSRPVVSQKRSSTAVSRSDDRETTPTPSGGREKAEGRIRKKRRITKSVTKMSDKGYIGMSSHQLLNRAKLGTQQCVSSLQ
jgi:hypothetical protein